MDSPGWSLDTWQVVASVVGALAAVLALGVSVAAFYVAFAGTRVAQLVVRWDSNQRLTLENRGPASAKSIRLVLHHRPSADEDAGSSSSEIRHRETIELLPAGFVHEDRVDRVLMQVDHAVEVSWRDGRWLRQKYEVPLRQEVAPRDLDRPLLTKRQVSEVAQQLGAGIGAAFRDEQNSVARRTRRDR